MHSNPTHWLLHDINQRNLNRNCLKEILDINRHKTGSRYYIKLTSNKTITDNIKRTFLCTSHCTFIFNSTVDRSVTMFTKLTMHNHSMSFRPQSVSPRRRDSTDATSVTTALHVTDQRPTSATTSVTVSVVGGKDTPNAMCCPITLCFTSQPDGVFAFWTS